MSSNSDFNDGNEPLPNGDEPQGASGDDDIALDEESPAIAGSVSSYPDIIAAAEGMSDGSVTSTSAQQPLSRSGSFNSIVVSDSDEEEENSEAESGDYRSLVTSSSSTSSDEQNYWPHEGGGDALLRWPSNLIVQKALRDPDSLTPEEMGRLVDAMVRKVISHYNSSYDAAIFCACVMRESRSTRFRDLLLCSFRNWVNQQTRPPTGLLITGGPPVVDRNSRNDDRWQPFLSFLGDLVKVLAEEDKGSDERLTACTRSVAVFFCESCAILATSAHRGWFERVVIVHGVLMTTGKVADDTAPTSMASLATCLWGILQNPDLPVDLQLILREVLEYRDSGWKPSFRHRHWAVDSRPGLGDQAINDDHWNNYNDSAGTDNWNSND